MTCSVEGAKPSDRREWTHRELLEALEEMEAERDRLFDRAAFNERRCDRFRSLVKRLRRY